MLRVHTGENRMLSDAMIRMVGRALAEEDCAQYIIVPRQLTLLTERMLIEGLQLRGSFRLQVMSPARLCLRIFEETGMPGGTRVDERGRVMLVRGVIRSCSDALTVYKNTDRRRGFAEKCARQLETFMQGGLTPADLRACAEESGGMTQMKLRDLAALMEAYEEALSGKYQDGESELILAAQRLQAQRIPSLEDGHFWFFGFDLVPPTLTALMAQISKNAAAELFLALGNDRNARDYDCYLPMEKALGRLISACREVSADIRRQALADDGADDELRMLARELYAWPAERYPDEPGHVHLLLAKDPREECMLAAATARKMAMQGCRYGDMQLICADMDSYRPLLIEAFGLYEVPLFLGESRPVSRMAAAECLLSALKMIEKNFRCEDVFTLMRTGYARITRDEADRLSNYAIRRGIDNGRWMRPFVRGETAEIAEMEEIRRRLIGPVLALREKLKAAEDLKGQLAALFGYLEDIGAYQTSLDMQAEMNAQGMREAAGELSQAWNRIIGALDQMAELMGDKRMSLRELSQTLSESLEAAAIKALPQSGDAVYAQSSGRMLMQRAKLLMALGMADRGAAGDDALLTAEQRKSLSDRTKAYLGPDERDSARLRRFYLKSALGMAEEEVYISCPLSAADGSALRPDAAVSLIRGIFPKLKETGGVHGDAETELLLANAPRAAASLLAGVYAGMRDGESVSEAGGKIAASLDAVSENLPDVRDRLRRIGALLAPEPDRGMIDPASARALYGRMQHMSITRLEKFANCPFSFFAHYGLQPKRTEPFEMDRRAEGTFLHDAVYEFLKSAGDELNGMSRGEAEARMALIADGMLENLRTGSPMEDSASARAESRALRAAACRCAGVLAEQMHGSSFHTRQLERSFGREDGAQRLRAGDVTLEGRIDRMDGWEDGNSLRVIDFKLGGKPLNLTGAYYGLQLQLPIYLGAGMKQTGARSAGVYYFALDEGITDTQSTDPAEVEKLRAKEFRMSGLLPQDPELIRAQTPDVERVFKARVKTDGSLYGDVPCADDVNFDRLIRHTLKMAQRHIDAIRAGDVRVSPVNFENREPCGICDYRAACLFDAKTDGGCVRRIKNIKWNEVFDRIALEDEAEQREP